MTQQKFKHDLMTNKYDDRFQSVKELKWDPWVGKDYAKTKIFILGKSTYHRQDECEKEWSADWVDEGKYCRTPNRTLVTECFEGDRHKPFSATAKMMIEGCGKEDVDENHQTFWASLAFANHCQNIVSGPQGACDSNEQANIAFQQILDIIEPALVIIWGVGLFGTMYQNCEPRDPPAGKTRPRILPAGEAHPVMVGIQHPSLFFNRKKWFEFLSTDEVTKAAVGKWAEYLKAVLR